MASIEAFLSAVEHRRAATSARLDPHSRASKGQFFTPRASASLLAAMAPPPTVDWRLIDPGAGVGSLSAALVARWLRETDAPSMSILAYEVDASLIEPLEATLADARDLATAFGRTLNTAVRNEDFVLSPPARGTGNIVLMNPPYKKLNLGSPECVALADGKTPVRVTNLYAAFLVRAVRALAPAGELVAITPRSFANGPYFRELRSELLRQASFRRIHVFEARDRVFADADVLQENVVFSMGIGAPPIDITITTSRDAVSAVTTTTRRYEEVVHAGDAERFIRLPLDDAALVVAERMAAMPLTLSESGHTVSTGRVVDFRVREHLRDKPGCGTVPLVYPQNLRSGSVTWPVPTRKPQALVLGNDTTKLVLPNEHYVVVKRFSSKEEPRRVVAAVVDPRAFSGAEVVAFENHLNVFHVATRGLDPDVANGLCAYLNSRFVDDYVRQFNGHTQINATDLRGLRYPTLQQLGALGRASTRLVDRGNPDDLDRLLEELIALPAEAMLAAA